MQGVTRGPGRPTFEPTEEQRLDVEEMVACGMRQDDIARAVGISTPTLVKRFADELAGGGARRRAEVVKMLFGAARKGNVAAQKKLEEMTARAMAAEAFQAPAETPKGKKEAAVDAAHRAGRDSEWGSDLIFPGAAN